MVKSFISRIGMAGVILIASLVIFAFLAGGVVVHRLDTSPAASSEQAGDQAGDQAEKDQGQSKPKHANQGQGHSTKDANKADDTEND